MPTSYLTTSVRVLISLLMLLTAFGCQNKPKPVITPPPDDGKPFAAFPAVFAVTDGKIDAAVKVGDSISGSIGGESQTSFIRVFKELSDNSAKVRLGLEAMYWKHRTEYENAASQSERDAASRRWDALYRSTMDMQTKAEMLNNFAARITDANAKDMAPEYSKLAMQLLTATEQVRHTLDGSREIIPSREAAAEGPISVRIFADRRQVTTPLARAKLSEMQSDTEFFSSVSVYEINGKKPEEVGRTYVADDTVVDLVRGDALIVYHSANIDDAALRRLKQFFLPTRYDYRIRPAESQQSRQEKRNWDRHVDVVNFGTPSIFPG